MKLEGVDEHQPAPTVNARPAIQDLVIMDLRARSLSLDRDPNLNDAAYDQVIADIQARKLVGLQRYGTLLQAFNGRDALLDAYQEVLDRVQYLAQCSEEGRDVIAIYETAIGMALKIRTLIEERTNEAGSVISFGDPSRGD